MLEQLQACAGTESVGSSSGTSGDTTISGVGFLTQPDSSSLSNQLASSSGTNTLQYYNGYVSPSETTSLHVQTDGI